MDKSPLETVILNAIRLVIETRKLERIYPYHLILWCEDVAYSESHLRRILADMARKEIITRIGGERSRRGYTLATRQ